MVNWMLVTIPAAVNQEGTHTKMPHVSTDDYMAVEVTETGHVKLTMDMGAATGKQALLFTLEINLKDTIFISNDVC